MDKETLISQIIDCAYQVRLHLAPGYIEKVYENAMMIEMENVGLTVKQQVPIQVNYKGAIVGEFVADMIVNDQVVLELKAVQNLCEAHEVQLVNYLVSTGIQDGLLINFGNPKTIEIKRKFKDFKPKKI